MAWLVQPAPARQVASGQLAEGGLRELRVRGEMLTVELEGMLLAVNPGRVRVGVLACPQAGCCAADVHGAGGHAAVEQVAFNADALRAAQSHDCLDVRSRSGALLLLRWRGHGISGRMMWGVRCTADKLGDRVVAAQVFNPDQHGGAEGGEHVSDVAGRPGRDRTPTSALPAAHSPDWSRSLRSGPAAWALNAFQSRLRGWAAS